MDKSRLKNYALWVSVAAFIGMMLQNFGLFTKLGLTNDTYSQLVNALLGVLVLAGILNNPTTLNSGFLDDKKTPETPKVIDPTNITNDMK
jgi:uncharacterized membrane protein